GSESGTVRYITNQPKLGTTQWFGELDGSTIQHGNQAGNVKFGFNVPLGEIAALRASAYYNAVGGYIDSPGVRTTSNGSIQPAGTIGQPEPVYSLNAPLYDATGGGDPARPNRKPATTFTQELRLSGTQDRFRWVLGGFYAHLHRDYGQDLPVTGFTARSGIPS